MKPHKFMLIYEVNLGFNFGEINPSKSYCQTPLQIEGELQFWYKPISKKEKLDQNFLTIIEELKHR